MKRLNYREIMADNEHFNRSTSLQVKRTGHIQPGSWEHAHGYRRWVIVTDGHCEAVYGFDVQRRVWDLFQN